MTSFETQRAPFLRGARLEADATAQLPAWLRELPIVRALTTAPLRFEAPITVISGENGTGKSTLIEALAVGSKFNPEGGSRHASLRVHDEAVSPLHEFLTLQRHNAADGFFLRGESYFDLAGWYETLPPPPPGAPRMDDLLQMSHGQSLMALIERRFHTRGLFFLDEPEAGLSHLRQLELLGKLSRLAAGGSQIVLATHSPILLAIPDAQVLELDETGAHSRAFNQTAAFRAAQEFCDDPHGTINYLTADDTDDADDDGADDGAQREEGDAHFERQGSFVRSYRPVRQPRPNTRAAEASWVDEVSSWKAIRRSNGLDLDQPITLLTGENGVGKSTLLEDIAVTCGFNDTGGAFGAPPTSRVNPLRDAATVIHRPPAMEGYFLRAESQYQVVDQFNLNHDANLLAQSHGEAVMHIIDESFHGDGLFLLDEPEAGLSFVRQMALVVQLSRLAAAGAQLIIATHSPVLLGLPDARIYEFSSDGGDHFADGLDVTDTTSYRALRDFFADPVGIGDYMVDVMAAE